MDLVKFREDNKYIDLHLIVNDEIIKVHKMLICEKSKFIRTSLEWKEKEFGGHWPPINELKLPLPDNISIDDFKETINYLYDKYYKVTDSKKLFLSLLYLMVDNYMIVKLLRKYHDISTIKLVIENLGVNELTQPLIHSYGKELDIKNDLVFGIDIKPEILKEKYLNHSKFGYNKLPREYIESKGEGQWIYFSNVDYKKDPQKFTVFGVDWELDRFIYDYGRGDIVDLIKIYASEDTTLDEEINMRCYFVLYSVENNPRFKIVQISNLNPIKFKHSYMKYNYRSNEWSLTVNNFKVKPLHIAMYVERL